MSLDERLRAELRRTSDHAPLDDDRILDQVWSTHRRDRIRARVARQSTAAVVVISLFAIAAIIASWRGSTGTGGQQTDRYRSTAIVRVAPAAASYPTTNTGVPPPKLSDPRDLALAPGTRRATLLASHLAPDDSRIDFRATLNYTEDVLLLAATAPTSATSEAIARNWAAVFATARREEARHQVLLGKLALTRQVTRLHNQLTAVDKELARLDPAAFGHILAYDSSYGPSSHPSSGRLAPPVPSRQDSVHVLNLANARTQLLSALADQGVKSASLQIENVTPQVYASLISQSPAIRIHKPSPTRSPALAIWIGGVIAVLAAALVTYRRRTRSLRQVSA